MPMHPGIVIDLYHKDIFFSQEEHKLLLAYECLFVDSDHLEILLKCRFWFFKSGLGIEFSDFNKLFRIDFLKEFFKSNNLCKILHDELTTDDTWEATV